jgi:hypothetical protein
LDALVGFAGGILGGLAGLSGPLPTLWASVRGRGKDGLLFLSGVGLVWSSFGLR